MRTLHRRALRDIRSFLNASGDPEAARLLRYVDDALKPRVGVQVLRKEKKARKDARRENTAEVRAAVFARAWGRCEVCEKADATDLEHVFGRVRVKQSPDNCLALCRPCHVARTNLQGGAVLWWSAYWKVFTRLGLAETARMCRRQMNWHEAKDTAKAQTAGRAP